MSARLAKNSGVLRIVPLHWRAWRIATHAFSGLVLFERVLNFVRSNTHVLDANAEPFTATNGVSTLGSMIAVALATR